MCTPSSPLCPATTLAAPPPPHQASTSTPTTAAPSRSCLQCLAGLSSPSCPTLPHPAGFHIDPYHGNAAADLMADFFEKCAQVRGRRRVAARHAPGDQAPPGAATSNWCVGAVASMRRPARRLPTPLPPALPRTLAHPPPPLPGPQPLDQGQRGRHGAHLLAVGGGWAAGTGSGAPGAAARRGQAQAHGSRGCAAAQPLPPRCGARPRRRALAPPSLPSLPPPPRPAATPGTSTPAAWSRCPTSTPSGSA